MCEQPPVLRWSCAPCRFILRNTGDVSTGTTSYQLPMECPSNNELSSNGKPCTGSNFLPQGGPGSTVYTNHQELRVQEQMQCLEPGSVPASIVVTVQDEIADCCQPGGACVCMHARAGMRLAWLCAEQPLLGQQSCTYTLERICRHAHLTSNATEILCWAAVSCLLRADDVEVTGIVRAQWRPLFPGARCDGTLMLHACHLRTINSIHRAVAPPPEGLAEQFRCDGCTRGTHTRIVAHCACMHVKLASRPYTSSPAALARPFYCQRQYACNLAPHTLTSMSMLQGLLGVPRILPTQGTQQDPGQHLPSGAPFRAIC